MKTINRTTSYSVPELENIITKKEIELKEMASKHARHLAGKNLPALTGDSLASYLGPVKAACESLIALTRQYTQPHMHEAERNIESDFTSKKHKRLDEEIQKRQHAISSNRFDLQHADMSSYYRIIIAGIIGFLICIGETAYNIQSFELVTDNFLYAVLFSIACSVTALTLAHCIPIMYKKFTTRLGRIGFGSGMLIAVALFFSALAVFRSQFLKDQSKDIDSKWFVIINLIFFLVALLVSAIMLPTWEELKKNWRQFMVRRSIRKQKRKIHRLFQEKEKLRIEAMEHEKHCARVAHYAHSCECRINKLYHDCAATFKSINIAHRPDCKKPDCFNEPIEDLQTTVPPKPNDQ